MSHRDETRASSPAKLNRRTFLHWSAGTAATASLLPLAGRPAAAAKPAFPPKWSGLAAEEEPTIAGLQAAMASGQLTARALVQMYLERIDALDKHGPTVNSVLELNPDALAIAAALDEERRTRGPRGPLHGIPILLKDNIDTADKMMTTAGSIALMGAAPTQDATVAKKLRDAGAILLGKANLSEWANFRSTTSTSGWSGRGGLTRNPYVLDRTACGSSSGSGAAVAANFCVAALGTETDGSVTCPSSICGIVGIKPTVGLASRAGIIPIAHSQDTAGPHARTVTDVAIVLSAMTGVDPRDPATQASDGKFATDYTKFLDPNGLKGARIGIPRKVFYGAFAKLDALMETAIKAMKDAGAVIVDPADLPTADEFLNFDPELQVLLYEFKADLNAYLATRPGVPVHTLEELIAFNSAHADQELKFFGQEIFEMAQAKGSLIEQDYVAALKKSQSVAREQGIDAVMDKNQLDALFVPTVGPAWTIDLIYGDRPDPKTGGPTTSPAARAGYPHITVPAGFLYGLPVGASFFGRAWSEPTLIKLAFAFEQITKARRPPQFLPTVPS